METLEFTRTSYTDGGPSRPQGPTIIYLPPARILRETYTIFNLAIAYAGITPRISRRRLVDWVYDRIIGFDGMVIDQGGQHLNLHAIDIDEVFGDDCSASWSGDFLGGRARPRTLSASPKITARIKLIWIALAIHNPAAARDVLR